MTVGKTTFDCAQLKDPDPKVREAAEAMSERATNFFMDKPPY